VDYLKQDEETLAGVAAAVGALNLVPDQMSQGRLRDLARERGALTGPIAECATEAMHRHVRLHPAEHHFECHDRERPASLHSGEYEIRRAHLRHRSADCHATSG